MTESTARLKIIKTGPGTSIQDLGRSGVGKFGIPYSGVQDRLAFDWVNHLLKNPESAAVLEINQPGFTAEFEFDTTICLAGAISEISLDGRKQLSYGLIQIQAGAKLEIGKIIEGSLVTLGIKGGFQTEVKFESRSWYEGITTKSQVKKGDLLPYFKEQKQPKSTASRIKWDFNHYKGKQISVNPGPEWKQLDQKTQDFILRTHFTISPQKNRMAIQLEELIKNSISEIATAPVFPGTIQLTSGGKAIILMQDAQVTGGYPRILQILPEMLAILAQKKPGSQINFRLEKLK